MKSYARPEIADLSGYVPGEQPPPGKFVKLNTNENPYPPSDAVVRALQEACAVGLRRYPDPQATAFRLRAADVYGIDPAHIVCGNGSDDLLTIAVRTFVAAGQALRVPTPSYTLYETLAGLQGARCDAIPFQPDWTLPEHFGDVAEDVRLVILANPNSPSGSFVSPDDVLHLANRLPCPLLVDEAYVEFSDQDCLDLIGRAENIIITRSLSKSHALAGLRFGFAVAPPHLIEPMLKLKDSYNCGALAIAGATAAIGDQTWLHATRARILATRERLAIALAQLGFQVTPSQANFLWCTRQDPPLRHLFDNLKRHQILVRYLAYPNWGEGLRISVGTDEQTDALLTVLATMLGSRGAGSLACLE